MTAAVGGWVGGLVGWWVGTTLVCDTQKRAKSSLRHVRRLADAEHNTTRMMMVAKESCKGWVGHVARWINPKRTRVLLRASSYSQSHLPLLLSYSPTRRPRQRQRRLSFGAAYLQNTFRAVTEKSIKSTLLRQPIAGKRTKPPKKQRTNLLGVGWATTVRRAPPPSVLALV